MTVASFVGLYLAGLATFASPCILPLLPLYAAILSGPPSSSRLRRALAGLGFVVGLSIVFVVLGMGVSALALALSAHRRALMMAAGIVMIGLGAQLAGLLHLGVLDTERRPLLTRVPSPGGFLGGLLFGAAFALGWTPCVGPVLGATLSYAASHSASPLLAAAELGSYALGLSTPLVAVAIAAPRVLAFARRLAFSTPLVQRGTGVVLVAMGLLIATDHVNLLAPKALTTTVAQTPTAAHQCVITGANTCLPSADEARPDIVANIPLGRAHLIEFVSPHCTVCAKTAPLVAELERKCTGNDGSIVHVDVETPAGRALAERFAVHAVPTFLELDAHGAELSRLVGEQSRQELELALATLRGEACSLL